MYSSSPSENKWQLRNKARYPQLASIVIEAWDQKTPPEARSPEYGYEHSIIAESLEHHQWFHNEVHGPPAAIHAYRGRAADGEVYTAVFIEREPSASDDHSDRDAKLTALYTIEEIDCLPLRAYLYSLIDENGGIHVEEANRDKW